MTPHAGPIGFPLLGVPDEHGQWLWPGLAQSVRDGVRVVLATRPGEQLMRPDFGGGIEALLHEPNTVGTRRRLHDLVQQSLRRWEPRLLLDAVEVWEVPAAPTQLRIEVRYRLALTGAPGRMNVNVQMEN